MSEHVYINLNIDWTKAKTVAAGVDVGAVSSKAIVLVDGEPYVYSQVKTRIPEESAFRAINTALDKTDLKLENIQCIVGTGCGKKQVSFAHKTISEIECAAAGAVHIWGPSVHTVLDAGGQSIKVIHVTEKGRVTNFLWNDKCAAGIGRSLETFADLVKKEVKEIGNIALQADKYAQLSDFCAIYAQSEALDLIRSKEPLEEVIAGFHRAMAKRISTLANRAGVKKELAIIGGLAKNLGLMDSLESKLEISRLDPKLEWDPALTVALGAALFGAEYC